MEPIDFPGSNVIMGKDQRCGMTRLARLTSDWIAVRELKQEHTGSVIQLEDLNRKPNTIITGIVEQVGPGRRGRTGTVTPVQIQVGQTVYYPIEAGRARLPWDLDVRIMRETDVAGVVVWDGDWTPEQVYRSEQPNWQPVPEVPTC